MDNMKMEEEQEYENTQFNVRRPKNNVICSSVDDNLPSSFQPLSIKDTSKEQKTIIEILKRNFDADDRLQSAEQFEFLAALTTAGVNDVFDMERYELLGDAFLKFSVSLYLANKFTNWNEGFLTIVKGRLVSNRNLLYLLSGTDICQRICGAPFKPNSAWLPPLCSLPSNLLELLRKNSPAASNLNPMDFYNLSLTENEINTGECSPEKLERFVQACNKNQELIAGDVKRPLENEINLFLYKDVLRDKVVADTLEAILGVCVKNYGIHRSFRMLEFFGICKADRDNPLSNLLDLKLSSHQLRTDITRKEIDGFLVNASILETNLGYKFKDRAYLLQALTHPSFPTNRITGKYTNYVSTQKHQIYNRYNNILLNSKCMQKTLILQLPWIWCYANCFKFQQVTLITFLTIKSKLSQVDTPLYT